MAEIDEKKLAEIQEEMMKKLDQDLMDEEEIEEKSSYLASALMMNPIVKAEVNGTRYTFKYRVVNSKRKVGNKYVDTKVIVLIIADDIKFQIAGKKYMPFTANAEIVDELSMQENLRGVINSFIRHITGKIKPEAME